MRLKPQTYAITILTHRRQRIFQRTANAELMISTLFRHRDQGRFSLHGFVIMPDHIHVLVTPTESPVLLSDTCTPPLHTEDQDSL